MVETWMLIPVIAWTTAAAAAEVRGPARSPFEDAVAAWHMADEGAASGEQARLTVRGNAAGRRAGGGGAGGIPAPRRRRPLSPLLHIDRPFRLKVMVAGDLLDACIDDRRTIIVRNRDRLTGDRLSFFVDHGEVAFEGVQVRPLAAP